MRIYWACPLRAGNQPNTFQPRIENIRNDPVGGNFPCKWLTTDAVRAAPWAVGVADVTPAQQALIDLDGQIHYVIESDWTAQFNTQPGVKRTRINSFCTAIGVTKPPNNEVMRDFVNRLCLVIQPVESIEDILAKL